MRDAKSNLVLLKSDYTYAEDAGYYYFRHKYHSGAAFKQLIKLTKDAWKATEQGAGYIIDIRRKDDK